MEFVKVTVLTVQLCIKGIDCIVPSTAGYCMSFIIAWMLGNYRYFIG